MRDFVLLANGLSTRMLTFNGVILQSSLVFFVRLVSHLLLCTTNRVKTRSFVCMYCIHTFENIMDWWIWCVSTIFRLYPSLRLFCHLARKRMIVYLEWPDTQPFNRTGLPYHSCSWARCDGPYTLRHSSICLTDFTEWRCNWRLDRYLDRFRRLY